MKAMILAAGEGTRLRPLTLDCPKCMLPIGGMPLLEHAINLLKVHGVTEIAINLYHKPEAVTNYFGSGENFGVSITYSVEEQLLGTAGAVKRPQGYFDETFVVIYGDLLTKLDITSLVRFHEANGALATIALYEVEDPSDCGIVDLDDGGRIRRFVEKPDLELIFSNLANAGVYVMDPEVTAWIPPNTFYDFGHDLLPELIHRGFDIYGYPITDYLIDIGTIEKYERAQADFLEGKLR